MMFLRRTAMSLEQLFGILAASFSLECCCQKSLQSYLSFSTVPSPLCSRPLHTCVEAITTDSGCLLCVETVGADTCRPVGWGSGCRLRTAVLQYVMPRSSDSRLFLVHRL